MSKLLKVAALAAAIFSFSVNAEERISGFNVQLGGGKTFAVRENKNLDFGFSGTAGGASGVNSIISDTKLDNAYLFFGGVNYSFENGFETGVEVSYAINDQIAKENSAVSLKNKAMTVLAKGIYNFDLGTKITPFVGAGIGASRVDYSFNDGIKSKSFDDLKKVKLAYMGTAGLAVDLNETVKLGAAYSYRATADIKGDNVASDYSDVTGNIEKFSDIKNGTHNAEVFIKFGL